MSKTTNEDLLKSSLELVNDSHEQIQCAIHGVLLNEKSYTVGFFGLTNSTLVIALPDILTGKRIISKANIPLHNIISVKEKKTVLTHQTIITITLNDGKIYGIRVSERAKGLPKQVEQLNVFINTLLSLDTEKG